jgi:cation transport regulator ChaB
MDSKDNWSRRIRSATTTAAVLEIVGSFVGSIPPTELERLPREIRTELGREQRDIHAMALQVLREDLRHASDERGVEVLHEVALTFAEASGRVAQIEGET